MCDVFTHPDAKNLLKNKHLVFIGGSNIRAMYKDLVWLLNHNSLIGENALKRKLEPSFEGDSLVTGERLVRGRDYEEVRRYRTIHNHIEFFFITRCYTNKLETFMTDVKKKRIPPPDLVIINSCLWDITRWGPNGVPEYKDNMVKLMKLFKTNLPADTLVVWMTAPPVSQQCRGGLLVNQVKFFQYTLRFEVMEANLLARQLVVAYGYDILDVHYYLRMQIHMRASDGIHWFPIPVRHMTNLLLTHVALSWECPLPGNFQGPSLERMKNMVVVKETKEVELPQLLPAVLPKPPSNPSPFRRSTKASSTSCTPLRETLMASPKSAASPLRMAIKAKLQKRKLLLSSESEMKENITPSEMANKYKEAAESTCVSVKTPTKQSSTVGRSTTLALIPLPVGNNMIHAKTTKRTRWDSVPTQPHTRSDSVTAYPLTQYNSVSAQHQTRWDSVPAQHQTRWDSVPAQHQTRWDSVPAQHQTRWDSVPAQLQTGWNFGSAQPQTQRGSFPSQHHTRWDSVPAQHHTRWDSVPAQHQTRWDSITAQLQTQCNSISQQLQMCAKQSMYLELQSVVEKLDHYKEGDRFTSHGPDRQRYNRRNRRRTPYDY